MVRTRVPEALNDLDIVLDVGAVYDPGAHRDERANSARATVLLHTPLTRRYALCVMPVPSSSPV